MLNELDKELEQRGLNFVRYADDCIITVRSRQATEGLRASVYRETGTGSECRKKQS